ncbi:MAG: paraquat-inducible protein A [Gammaproteobacteria bacterium]|nr:paraquat-inducible protein A [Gammaproteobacteria bacterium]
MTACNYCDCLINLKTADNSESVFCPNCNSLLNTNHPFSIEHSLALSISGLIVFIPAVSLPIMILKVLGEQQQATMLSAVGLLFEHQLFFIAASVFLFSILIPLIKLVIIAYVSLCLVFHYRARHLNHLFRWYHQIEEWGMLEVYMLGIIVAYVKLTDIADVFLGTGLFAFICLLTVVSLLSFMIDEWQFWQRLSHPIHNQRKLQ